MSSVLSMEDKRMVDDALGLTKELNHSVSVARTQFEKKGSVGLWWDAKGFWNSLDKHAVLKNMDMYKEIYENILTCLELIEKGEEESYEELLKLYGKLQSIEICSKDNIKDNSKALCKVAGNFLDHHFKLDDKLKRVECVVLTKNVVKLKEVAENLSEMLSTSVFNLNTLSDDNHTLRHSVNELHEENQELKDNMATILRDNQDLRNTITEMNARAERRFQEMAEENRRNMEQLMIELRNHDRN